MRKLRLLLPALLAVFVLAACSPQAAAPETAATPTNAPLLLPAAAADFQASGPAKCTVVSLQPTPSPTEIAVFPPVSELDWAEGPADAKVTIIEYSEFQ